MSYIYNRTIIQAEISRRTFLRGAAAVVGSVALSRPVHSPAFAAFDSGGPSLFPTVEAVPTPVIPTPEVPKLPKFFFGTPFSSNEITPQTLSQLGVDTTLNWRTDATPAITEAVRENRLKYFPMLRTGEYHWKRLGFMDYQTGTINHSVITRTVRNAIRDFGTGLSWIIGNEPNVITDDSDSDAIAPREFAVQFDVLVRTVKKEDPTALIVGPGVTGWLQKPEGKKWYEEFYRAYRNTHGGKLPPIDIHNLHLYDQTNWQLTWDKRIAYGGSDVQLLLKELESFREWANIIDPQKPILITEYGMVHCSNSWKASMDCLPQDSTQLEQTAIGVLTELTMYFTKHQNRLKLAGIFPFFDGLAGNSQNAYPLRLFQRYGSEIRLTHTGETYRRLINLHTR